MKSLTAVVLTVLVLEAGLQAQTVALNRLMRQKLADAQGVLSAVVLSNWTELEKRSRALAAAAQDPAWLVLRTPEYTKQSEAFLFAVNDLVEAASRHDAEAAPLAYTAMTMRCVQCHRYVARARIATQK